MNETSYNDNKAKIFVRHPRGGSAGFLITLLRSFSSGNKKLDNPTIGHRNRDFAQSLQEHNFQMQWRDKILYAFDTNNLDDKINHIRKNYFFGFSKYSYYICHTHVTNPDPLMLAYNNTKLINIVFEDKDVDQLIYNWATKVLLESPSTFSTLINEIKVKFPNQIEESDTETSLRSDVKKLVNLIKLYKQEELTAYSSFKFCFSYPKLDLPFSSIRNKKIINNLDQLANFIGVELTNKSKLNAIDLINQYSNNQRDYTYD